MNNDATTNSQTSKENTEDIKEEFDVLKNSYAALLKDHVDLASMVAQLSADNIDASDHELLKQTKENIEKIQRKVKDIHNHVSSTVASTNDDIEQFKEQIERHPLSSVIGAFAIGYFIAKVFGLGGRH
jgi:ElaB/YqjD/DUF883 family membrane-anchored ribosome-binding protein